MARGKLSQSNTTWVELQLTAKQKLALEADHDFKVNFWKALDLFSADKLKVQFKWDPYNECGMCTIQSQDDAFGEPTTIWVMRSSSAAGALLKAAYFYAVVSDRTLPSGQTRKELESDDSLWT